MVQRESYPFCASRRPAALTARFHCERRPGALACMPEEVATVRPARKAQVRPSSQGVPPACRSLVSSVPRHRRKRKIRRTGQHTDPLAGGKGRPDGRKGGPRRCRGRAHSPRPSRRSTDPQWPRPRRQRSTWSGPAWTRPCSRHGPPAPRRPPTRRRRGPAPTPCRPATPCPGSPSASTAWRMTGAACTRPTTPRSATRG